MEGLDGARDLLEVSRFICEKLQTFKNTFVIEIEKQYGVYLPMFFVVELPMGGETCQLFAISSGILSDYASDFFHAAFETVLSNDVKDLHSFVRLWRNPAFRQCVKYQPTDLERYEVIISLLNTLDKGLYPEDEDMPFVFLCAVEYQTATTRQIITQGNFLSKVHPNLQIVRRCLELCDNNFMSEFVEELEDVEMSKFITPSFTLPMVIYNDGEPETSEDPAETTALDLWAEILEKL